MIKEVDIFHSFNLNNKNFFIYKCNKNEGLPEHKHQEKQYVDVQEGKILIKINNEDNILDKNSKTFCIQSNVPHSIQSLEDKTTFFNIFSK